MTAKVRHIKHDRESLERMMRKLHRTLIQVGVQGADADSYADRRVARASRAGQAAITFARLTSGHGGGTRKGGNAARKKPPRTKKPAKKRGAGRSVIVPGGSDFRMVDLATVHEFGSKDGRIPQRSFLRSALFENRDRIRRAQRTVLKLASQGNDPTKSIKVLAVMLEGMVKKQITELRTPPLADATKKRRRKLTGDANPNPLVDTQQLRGSITAIVKGGTGG